MAKINMETKEWYKSKTLWFNIAVSITAGIMGLLPILQPLMVPMYYAIVLFGVGLVNVVLRSITDRGIE